MNIQALMKQAQSMQKNIMDVKAKIESTIFEGESELVCVRMSGDKKIKEVKIKTEDNLDKEDIEILQDMIMIAVNDAISKIEKETKQKMGNQASMFGDLL